jgi:hypothetical protein
VGTSTALIAGVAIAAVLAIAVAVGCIVLRWRAGAFPATTESGGTEMVGSAFTDPAELIPITYMNAVEWETAGTRELLEDPYE